jgi:hypothetical protein
MMPIAKKKASQSRAASKKYTEADIASAIDDIKELV